MAVAGIGSNLFNVNNVIKSIATQVSRLEGADAQKALSQFKGITDSFGGPSAFSGAGATTNLRSPQASGLADRVSGSGAGRTPDTSAQLWNSVPNLDAPAGRGANLDAPTGGAGNLNAPTGGAGGGSNLADAAKGQNYQYLDDRQKANLALQEASQKQSEAASLITTLMKMLHDTLTQIIQNMK